MKLSTAKEHRDFFQRNGWIEFEALMNDDAVNQADKALHLVLAERLNTKAEALSYLSSEKVFLQGRDTWRSHPFLHKLVTQLRYAEIASELIEKKPLRLGYDQYFQIPSRTDSLFPFFEKTATLESISCIKGVSCGLMLALEDAPSRENVSTEGVNIFPSKAGNGIFFKPDLEINWRNIFSYAGQPFYLIVYTSAYSNYILQPDDPNTHMLKRLGYVFNDKLNDSLHPFVYR